MRFQFPHALTLLVAGIVLAAALSHILPAGEYDRRDDPATGRKVVVAGTYHAVPSQPVGVFQTLVGIPRGMADAGSIIFMVFISGGAFTVIDQTGALRNAVGWLVRKLQRRKVLVIPIVCILFAVGGAIENTQEEIIALVPVLLLLTRRLGYDALTAVAMSMGAAAIGAAFSPCNPFQVIIAQNLAQLPLVSGAAFRMVFLTIAVLLWIAWTIRHATRTQTAADHSDQDGEEGFDLRKILVLAVVIVSFSIFVYGVVHLGWDFDQMSALFFAMGVAAGLVGRLGIDGTARALVEGFKSMAFAALLIGFARAIFIVMGEGKIVDTVVNGLVTPLGHLPVALSALGMMIVQTFIHFPVPSVSGQAVLTMPVLVPLSDLLGLSRQVTVLAYQYGAGLCELLTPTNGALMAIVAAAGVRFEQWLKFLFPIYLMIFALGAVAVFLGIALGLK